MSNIYNITSIYIAHYGVRMDSHQTDIIEYTDTVELQMLIRIEL